MLEELSDNDYDFVVITDTGRVRIPIITYNETMAVFPAGEIHHFGIELPCDVDFRGYRGRALEINDHGNVTVWDCFKNGNRREIASRV